jgi:hypothetical protein
MPGAHFEASLVAGVVELTLLVISLEYENPLGHVLDIHLPSNSKSASYQIQYGHHARLSMADV